MICLSKINRADRQRYFVGMFVFFRSLPGLPVCCLLTLSGGDVSHCVRTTEPEGGGHLPCHLLLCTQILSLQQDTFKSFAGTRPRWSFVVSVLMERSPEIQESSS